MKVRNLIKGLMTLNNKALFWKMILVILQKIVTAKKKTIKNKKIIEK